MNVKIKKNLWWLISSIALAIPIVLVINELSVKLGEKLLLGIVSYLILLVICGIVGIIANKIRKVLLKIIWIILGFIGTLFYILFVCIILAMFEPVTDEDISAQEESYRDMVHREFEADQNCFLRQCGIRPKADAVSFFIIIRGLQNAPP